MKVASRSSSKYITHHTIFFVDLRRPWRKIVEKSCPIYVGQKRTWARIEEDKIAYLSISAFYTRKAAEGKKRLVLQKAIRYRNFRWEIKYAINDQLRGLQPM